MGKLIAVTGPMASGKSAYLCSVLDKAKLRCERTGSKILAIKPSIDTRDTPLRSRNGQEYGEVTLFEDLVNVQHVGYGTLFEKYEIIVIDEINLIEDYVELEHLVSSIFEEYPDMTIYVAGLDTDFRGEPFDTTSRMLCLADEVVKLSAVCDICGDDATRTQRLINGIPASINADVIVVDSGGEVQYEPRCRLHHEVTGG